MGFKNFVPPSIVRKLSLFLILGVLVSGAAPNREAGNRYPFTGDVLSTPYGEILSGTLIVKMASGASKASIMAGKEAGLFGFTDARPMFSILQNRAGKRSQSLSRIMRIAFASSADPLRVASAVSRRPDVEYAVPYRVHRTSGTPPAYDLTPAAAAPLLVTPNDPRFPEQQYLSRIDAQSAWDIARGEDGDVVIAIVDGGTDWRHIDLRSNVWVNEGEIPGNGVDDDNNGLIDDVNGWNYANGTGDPTGLEATPENARHGTWVAGIAGAVTNNAEGISSAGWNTRFMPINTGSDSEEFDNLLFFGFQGIIYAAVMGADIINTSWGGIAPPDPFELDVIEFAYEEGALIVASSGNENINSDEVFVTPAGYDKVMAVGATFDRNDTRAGFSNYGVNVDLFAPGINILTTGPDNVYNAPGGTSFSSPLVAAVAALVKTHNPEFSVDEVRQQVRVTADDINGANASVYRGRLGKGRLNAFRALSELNWPSVRIASVDVEEISGNGDGFVQGGERVGLDVAFTNILSPVAGLNLSLSADDSLLTFPKSEGSIASLAGGDTQTVRFEVDVSSGTPQLHKAVIFVDMEAGDYTDRHVFSFTANPPAFLNHDSGSILTSITSEGNLGWVDTAGDITPFGAGFQFASTQLLFEGGLIVASGPTSVADAVRGADPTVQEKDFVPTPDTPLQIISPGTSTAQEGRVSLSDAGADNPMELSIDQTSYVDTVAGRDQFAIVKYRITNHSTSRLDNLYAGLFFDWDISENGQTDIARFDADRKLGYVSNAANLSVAGAGTRLLSSNGPVTFHAVDNPDEIYDDFTKTEKWNFLSRETGTRSLDQTDASTVLGTGPITLLPTCDVEVAFAVVAGRGRGNFLAAADSAAALWIRELRPTPAMNNAPRITDTLGDATVAEGETLTFTFVGTDEDVCDVTSFELIEGPNGAVLNGRSGLFRFSPDFDQAGTYPLVVSFSDGFAADTVRSLLTVANTNRAPAFIDPPSTEQVLIGATLEVRLEAEDPDGDPVTFGLAEPVANVSIDSTSGLLSFKPGNEQAGQADIRVRVSDGQAFAESLLQVSVIVPEFALADVYPNPFSPPTSIRVQVAERGALLVRIYDVAGRVVRTLVDEQVEIGVYTYRWDGRAESGEKLAGGVYFCRLQAEQEGREVDKIIKMVLLP